MVYVTIWSQSAGTIRVRVESCHTVRDATKDKRFRSGAWCKAARQRSPRTRCRQPFPSRSCCCSWPRSCPCQQEPMQPFRQRKLQAVRSRALVSSRRPCPDIWRIMPADERPKPSKHRIPATAIRRKSCGSSASRSCPAGQDSPADSAAALPRCRRSRSGGC